MIYILSVKRYRKRDQSVKEVASKKDRYTRGIQLLRHTRVSHSFMYLSVRKMKSLKKFTHRAGKEVTHL
jgi:hypothetical protein